RRVLFRSIAIATTIKVKFYMYTRLCGVAVNYSSTLGLEEKGTYIIPTFCDEYTVFCQSCFAELGPTFFLLFYQYALATKVFCQFDISQSVTYHKRSSQIIFITEIAFEHPGARLSGI